MNREAGLPARDPYLDLPLHGLQLIEASAGTGKTFTLATLVTRLVVERGLRVGQILAVTFTDAATQELRERLRLRLALAARLATALPAPFAACSRLIKWRSTSTCLSNAARSCKPSENASCISGSSSTRDRICSRIDVRSTFFAHPGKARLRKFRARRTRLLITTW